MGVICSKKQHMARPRLQHAVVRVTATLDEHMYRGLMDLGRREGLAVAWMVRRAVSEFLARNDLGPSTQLPLFANEKADPMARNETFEATQANVDNLVRKSNPNNPARRLNK